MAVGDPYRYFPARMSRPAPHDPYASLRIRNFRWFITSLLAAHLFLRTTWKRLLLVCFVIPLGLVRNGFRVWVIGSLCVHFGPQMIDSPFHRQGGPVFFVLSLIPLFLLAAWLRRHEQTAMERAVLPAGESKLGSTGF